MEKQATIEKYQEAIVGILGVLMAYVESLEDVFVKEYTAKLILLLSVPIMDKNTYIVSNKRLYDCLIKTSYKNDIVKELNSILSPTTALEQISDNSDKKDRVNHPFHYTSWKELCGVEVIDITRHMDFDLGNAVKYILRSGLKSEEGMSDKDKAVEDLKKAVWYIQDKIAMLEGKVGHEVQD